MKRLLFTVLLAGTLLTAGAQKPEKMTKKEREQALHELELYYRMETGQLFSFGNSAPRQVETLPWEAWAEEHREDREKLEALFGGFENAVLEPVADEPNACRVVFRMPTEEEGRFSFSSSVGFDDDFRTDDRGNRIGFHHAISAFCDLETEIDFRLTDTGGKPVYIAPEEDVLVVTGCRMNDYGGNEDYFGLQFPLSVPFSEADGGYVDVRLSGPDEYAWAEIPANAAGRELSLGGVGFRVEKIDDKGFVVSAAEADLERLDKLEYLYRRSDGIWKPTSTMWSKGPLAEMMDKQPQTDLSFDEWLAQKGVDPDRLEETLANFTDSDDEESDPARGIRFDSGMAGDALLLYMPTDSADIEPLATARIYAPSVGMLPEASVNNTLAARLLERLRRADSRNSTDSAADAEYVGPVPEIYVDPVTGVPVTEISSNDVFTTAVGKFEFGGAKGAPGRLREDCSLTAAERDALLAPNDAISYAMGVVQAERLAEEEGLKNLTSIFYLPEGQRLLIEWFGKGIRTAKELSRQTVKGEGAESGILTESPSEPNGIIGEAMAEADGAGVAQGIAFRYGVEAMRIYRSCTVPDLPAADSARVSGRRFDADKAMQGLGDYLQRQLKMGVQYAASILHRRTAAVEDLGYRPAADGLNDDRTEYLPDFQAAYAIDPQTGDQQMFQTVLSRVIQKPQAAAEQGLTGKVVAEAVIEADGSVNRVRIISSPHKLLSYAVADGLYRMRCRPATVGTQCVATKLTIPVVFP